MKFLTKEVKIGLAGIIALCLLVYGINYLKGVHMFKPTKYIYVKYKNINGLAQSSPVYADGYQIGIVRNIGYDYQHPGNVVVEVQLDSDARIPKGSSAELVAEMLGGCRMNLLLATDSQEDYNIGDTIPGTVNYGMMESAAALMPQVEQMLPKLDSILTSLNTILSDPNIPATLSALEGTMSNMQTSSAQLKHLLKNDIPQLTGKLNTIGDHIIVISDQLKDVNYASTFNKIDSTMNNLRVMTDKLNKKDNSIGRLLNDTEFYDNLNQTTLNASGLLEDLKAHPKRYVHFSIFGKKEK